MKTPNAAACDRILNELLGLELEALPRPPRVPSIADIEAVAYRVRDLIESRLAVTVRPGKLVRT